MLWLLWGGVSAIYLTSITDTPGNDYQDHGQPGQNTGIEFDSLAVAIGDTITLTYARDATRESYYPANSGYAVLIAISGVGANPSIAFGYTGNYSDGLPYDGDFGDTTLSVTAYWPSALPETREAVFVALFLGSGVYLYGTGQGSSIAGTIDTSADTATDLVSVVTTKVQVPYPTVPAGYDHNRIDIEYRVEAAGAVPPNAKASLPLTESWFGARLVGEGYWIQSTSPPATATLDEVRTRLGRRLVVYADTTGMRVLRYSDGGLHAETIESTTQISATDTLSAALTRDDADNIYLIHVVDASFTTIWRSRDQGASFTELAIISTGYEGCAADLDKKSGLLAVALWNDAADRWDLTVGTLNAAGTAWSFSTPVTIVSSALNGAVIRWQADGSLHFIYTTTGSVVTILRCRSLDSNGVGTWA